LSPPGKEKRDGIDGREAKYTDPGEGIDAP